MNTYTMHRGMEANRDDVEHLCKISNTFQHKVRAVSQEVSFPTVRSSLQSGKTVKPVIKASQTLTHSVFALISSEYSTKLFFIIIFYWDLVV